MNKIELQQKDRVITFEFYNLDNNLEITIEDDISEMYINLSDEQIKSLFEFFKANNR